MLDVGDPKQRLETEVDMLSPDFYTIVTSIEKGTKYNASASESHGKRCAVLSSEHKLTYTTGFNNDRAHAICRRPSEEFHFSGMFPVRLDLPTCSPSKSSRQALAHPGTFLGLAPHTESLARLSSAPLLKQLHKDNAIDDKIYSLTLLDTVSGILSLGGTIAREIEEAKVRGEVELKYFGDDIATLEWVNKQVDTQLRIAMPVQTPWDKHFKWTDVQGAAGWWTALMRGVWINGAKVPQPTCCLPALLHADFCPGAQESTHTL